MILYHGTNVDFESIDLNIGNSFKDFGKGFYLTPDLNTAIRMAQKKACIEWVEFVDANRESKSKTPIHDYEIVIGPIANDGVAVQLNNLHEGIYTPQQIAILLQDKYLDQQYYFGTERSIQYLRKIKVEIL